MQFFRLEGYLQYTMQLFKVLKHQRVENNDKTLKNNCTTLQL